VGARLRIRGRLVKPHDSTTAATRTPTFRITSFQPGQTCETWPTFYTILTQGEKEQSPPLCTARNPPDTDFSSPAPILFPPPLRCEWSSCAMDPIGGHQRWVRKRQMAAPKHISFRPPVPYQMGGAPPATIDTHVIFKRHRFSFPDKATLPARKLANGAPEWRWYCPAAPQAPTFHCQYLPPQIWERWRFARCKFPARGGRPTLVGCTPHPGQATRRWTVDIEIYPRPEWNLPTLRYNEYSRRPPSGCSRTSFECWRLYPAGTTPAANQQALMWCALLLPT